MKNYLIALVKSEIEYRKHALDILTLEGVSDVSYEDKVDWALRHSAALVHAKEILKRLRYDSVGNNEG